MGSNKASAVLSVLGLLLAAAACDGSGEFDGGIAPDAGPGGGSVPLADIGKPCTYHYDGVNPTNECPSGLQCLIFTGDGQYQSDLQLPGWEDQFTLYLGDRDEGYCTLKGTLAAPPQCPAGAVLKVLSTNVTVCLRTCASPADCGRPGYTCDVRYLDTFPGAPQPLCVKQCSFDVPDCVRSGIVVSPQDQQTLLPVLEFADLAGASQCGTTDGICGAVPSPRGAAGPGEPCSSTSQCEDGSVCLQGAIVAAVVDKTPSLDPNAPGFCASPCTPVAPGQDQQSNCSLGYTCQAGGNLTLGFPGTIVVDSASGAFDSRGGFCFHQCEAGVESACNPFPGTTCGSLDEQAVGDTWNAVTMCLPSSLSP